MKCFYHRSDLDGHCSGAIVKSKYPNCEMIGVDHGEEIDFSSIVKSEEIYIVDFSFPMEEMQMLNEKAKVHWIDHHKSAIDEAYNYVFIASGGQLIEIGRAGCELTWKYLYKNEVMPVAVYYLGRYDVWDHSDENTLFFQYGMRNFENTHPDNEELWQHLLDLDGKRVLECYDLENIISGGELILSYEELQNEKYARSMAYEANFKGLRAIVVNKPLSNSKIFDSIYDSSIHDIMVVFSVKGDNYKYTLFSAKDEVDVSRIAVSYGGGGHKSAAGFISKKKIV